MLLISLGSLSYVWPFILTVEKELMGTDWSTCYGCSLCYWDLLAYRAYGSVSSSHLFTERSNEQGELSVYMYSYQPDAHHLFRRQSQ